jgi:hypothetical protein
MTRWKLKQPNHLRRSASAGYRINRQSSTPEQTLTKSISFVVVSPCLSRTVICKQLSLLFYTPLGAFRLASISRNVHCAVLVLRPCECQRVNTAKKTCVPGEPEMNASSSRDWPVVIGCTSEHHVLKSVIKVPVGSTEAVDSFTCGKRTYIKGRPIRTGRVDSHDANRVRASSESLR